MSAVRCSGRRWPNNFSRIHQCVSLVGVELVRPSGSSVDRGAVPSAGAGHRPDGHADTVHDANGFRLDPAGGTSFFQVAAGGTFNRAVPGAKNNAVTNSPASIGGDGDICAGQVRPPGLDDLGSGGTLVAWRVITSSRWCSTAGSEFGRPSRPAGYLWQELDRGQGRASHRYRRTRDQFGLGDGRNELFLLNSTNPNTFSGGLYINGAARVAFDTNDAQLGAPGKISFTAARSGIGG